MYGISKDNSSRTVSYLPAGIHEDVKLDRITKEPAKEGSNQTTLRFHFSSNGEKFVYSEFQVNEEMVKKYPGKFSVEQALENAYNNLGDRIYHILASFVPQEALDFKSNSWDEFCDKVINIAGEAFKPERFRIKVVYNKAGFTTFPNFPPFIENITVSKTRLKINEKYDLMEKPKPTSEGSFKTMSDPISDAAGSVTVEPTETGDFPW